jgi:baculoviral IAP repeat-containing protein 6
MTTARCRIPTGYFYGHVVVLPEEVPPELAQSTSSLACTDLEKQLTILSKLFEDISCRYSLACSKLKELLRPFLVADMKNASHLATYMNIMRDKVLNTNNPEHTKIFGAYQESITYQRQLNTVRNVMNRLEASINRTPITQRTSRDLPGTSTDKLRAIAEGLLEVLLTIDTTIDIDPATCRKLFQGLCVSQASRLQLLAAIFLDKSCRTKSYWGNFLADTLTEMFATSNTAKFPQDRVFILLAYLSRRSPERSAVIDAGLRVVSQTLSPLINGDRRNLLAVTIDLPLLSWLLMYLSLQLDLSKSSLQSATRWDWVFGEIVGKANAESSKIGSRKKCFKRINKQQIDNLDAAQKLVQTSAQVQVCSRAGFGSVAF